MTRAPLLASAALLGLSLPAQAEQVFTEDVIVDGGLCAGVMCASGDGNTAGLRLTATNPSIIFKDLGGDQWSLNAFTDFQLRNLENSAYPFSVSGGVDRTALYIGIAGIALNNTNIQVKVPQKGLHLFDGQDPTMRLEQDTSEGYSAQIWDVAAGDAGYQLIHGNGTTTPFTIQNGAPSSGLVMDNTGRIGFGTSLPQRELHVVDGGTAALRLEQDTSGGFGHHTWDISSSDAGFLLSDVGSIFSTVPFRVENGALNSALILSSNGNIGMGSGAATPAAALHLHRNQGNAQMLIEEVNATANPRTLLNLQNNGRPEIVMGNTATNGEWSFGAGTDFFLKTGTVGSTSGAKTKVFTVKQNGDAIVFGTLTTGGTTCGTGCDRVFADDYALPSIADHAADMKRLGHLPNVGPTIEGEPINITDKLGRVLNELEHAHLYIADQEERLAAQGARIAAQDARIARLERLLEAGTE